MMKNVRLIILFVIIKIISTILMFSYIFSNSFMIFLPFGISAIPSLMAYSFSLNFSNGIAVIVVISLVVISLLWLTTFFLLLRNFIIKNSSVKIYFILIFLLIFDVMSFIVMDMDFTNYTKIIGILLNITIITVLIKNLSNQGTVRNR